MSQGQKVVIIGGGAFGLSTAYELASEGYQNISVLDRHVPPVPDGSSVDISRVIRFDYADDDYLAIAHEAYQKWSQSSKYHGIFFPSPFVLTSTSNPYGRAYSEKVTAALDKKQLPWTSLPNPEAAKQLFPTLSGPLAGPGFNGYYNRDAGWADAHKAIAQLRDDCIERDVSFITGRAGTVVGFDTDVNGKITAARTLAGTQVVGDLFVLSAGAWASSLVPMYNSTLTTGQALAYLRLTDAEMEKYKELPIYINFSSGWFNFPPHPDTQLLKMAVHGWGYTRAPTKEERALVKSDISSPPLMPPRQRPNFVPIDGEQRLREGLREILPELADRPFERLALCWYTDTPTGDFIMDFHPDHNNLFVAGGGSGHAFKFLPVLGKYTSLALHRHLSPSLAQKWRFRTEHRDQSNTFIGDGSRGGPDRRDLSRQELAKL